MHIFHKKLAGAVMLELLLGADAMMLIAESAFAGQLSRSCDGFATRSIISSPITYVNNLCDNGDMTATEAAVNDNDTRIGQNTTRIGQNAGRINDNHAFAQVLGTRINDVSNSRVVNSLAIHNNEIRINNTEARLTPTLPPLPPFRQAILPQFLPCAAIFLPG